MVTVVMLSVVAPFYIVNCEARFTIMTRSTYKNVYYFAIVFTNLIREVIKMFRHILSP